MKRDTTAPWNWHRDRVLLNLLNFTKISNKFGEFSNFLKRQKKILENSQKFYKNLESLKIQQIY